MMTQAYSFGRTHNYFVMHRNIRSSRIVWSHFKFTKTLECMILSMIWRTTATVHINVISVV